MFNDNFIVQSSLLGDYYKPKAIHAGLNYDALKFKKLKFPTADHTNELLSNPVMSNISIPSVVGQTVYSVNLFDNTTFIGNGIGSTFNLVTPNGVRLTIRYGLVIHMGIVGTETLVVLQIL